MRDPSIKEPRLEALNKIAYGEVPIYHTPTMEQTKAYESLLDVTWAIQDPKGDTLRRIPKKWMRDLSN